MKYEIFESQVTWIYLFVFIALIIISHEDYETVQGHTR